MALVNQNPQIENSFVEQFEGDVRHDYQRKGSQLLGTVRRKTNIVGDGTTFTRAGKSQASQKSRHGNVPVNNPDRTPVKCPVDDYYSGDYVDKLDELKVQHDERRTLVEGISYAMGRKDDDLIVQELQGGTNVEVHGSAGLTKAKVMKVRTYFGDNDVPLDGMRTLLVSPAGWEDLMEIDEFKNRDYLTPNEGLPWAGVGFQAKFWAGFLVMEFSGLNKTGNVRTCLAYHKTAIGHASGAEIYTDISWIGEKQAWFVASGMSRGAKRIDETGLYRIEIDESA